MKCECEINSTYVTLDVKHISGENIYLSFLSALKSTNYKVMICYNLVFNFKIFCHNYGSILTLIFFIVYVLFMIYYSYKEITPLKVDISKLLFEESEKLAKIENKEFAKIQKGEILKINEKVKKKTRKGKNYPPKKERNRKRKNDYTDGRKGTEHNELVQISKTNRKNKTKKAQKSGRRKSKTGKGSDQNDYAAEDINSNDLESDIHNKNIIINAKKKAKEELYKTQKMDNFELNDLDYEKACEFDDRGFCKTYWSILMREHIVLFTFFTWTDYNLFYVKIERFLVLICTQMTVNGLFFVHESMHRKYTNGEDFTFVQKLPQYIFTILVEDIIEVILCYLSMTDKHIYDIKDYSLVFNLKREKLCYIGELKCGNFVLSYEEGKIEIASLDLATKTLNVLQELEGHGSDVYDVKELSDGKLVSCSNNGEIIFWSLNLSLKTFEKFKFLKTYPKEYSSLLEDTERNKLICAPCFDSYATCIIDLQTYEIIATFNDIAGNGGSELYFVNDNIVIDNSAADEVGLFFIDMDKNEIVKHDEKFNDNKSSCFLKLKNENLLCSVVIENKKMNLSGSDDEEEDKNDDKGRTDIQCWEIDETGLDWKLLYTKEKADNYPIFYMTQLSDGKIVTCSNVVKVYQ